MPVNTRLDHATRLENTSSDGCTRARASAAMSAAAAAAAAGAAASASSRAYLDDMAKVCLLRRL